MRTRVCLIRDGKLLYPDDPEFHVRASDIRFREHEYKRPYGESNMPRVFHDALTDMCNKGTDKRNPELFNSVKAKYDSEIKGQEHRYPKTSGHPYANQKGNLKEI